MALNSSKPPTNVENRPNRAYSMMPPLADKNGDVSDPAPPDHVGPPHSPLENRSELEQPKITDRRDSLDGRVVKGNKSSQGANMQEAVQQGSVRRFFARIGRGLFNALDFISCGFLSYLCSFGKSSNADATVTTTFQPLAPPGPMAPASPLTGGGTGGPAGSIVLTTPTVPIDPTKIFERDVAPVPRGQQDTVTTKVVGVAPAPEPSEPSGKAEKTRDFQSVLAEFPGKYGLDRPGQLGRRPQLRAEHVDKLLDGLREECLGMQSKVLGRLRDDLEQCFDEVTLADGTKKRVINVERFKEWHELYEATAAYFAIQVVESHRAHAEQKTCINASTDQPFTEQQLEDFEGEVAQALQKSVSLVDGAINFGVSLKVNGEKVKASEATGKLLNNDGTPNFDEWEKPENRTRLDELFNPQNIKTKDTKLTRDLRVHEGDVVAGLGGLNVAYTVDGKSYAGNDKSELLRAAREQFASEVEGEGTEEGCGKRQQLLQALLGNLRDNRLQLDAFRDMHPRRREALRECMYSDAMEKAIDAKSEGDQIRALPLTVINDIVNAFSIRDEIAEAMMVPTLSRAKSGTGQIGARANQSEQNPCFFARFQEVDMFLRTQDMLALMLPDLEDGNWGYVIDDANVIAYNRKHFTPVDLKAEYLTPVNDSLRALEEVCPGSRVQMKLFRTSNKRFVLQCNLHLPSGGVEQNPGMLRDIHNAAKKVEAEFGEKMDGCRFVFGIGGDMNVRDSQVPKLRKKVYSKKVKDAIANRKKQGLEAELSSDEKQRMEDEAGAELTIPQDFSARANTRKGRVGYILYNAQDDPGKIGEQQGDVVAACGSGKSTESHPIQGDDSQLPTELQGKIPRFAYYTSKKTGNLCVDLKATHGSDHAAQVTHDPMPADGEDEGFTVTSFDCNVLASCTKNFAHGLEEKTENHTRNLYENCLKKYELRIQQWRNTDQFVDEFGGRLKRVQEKHVTDAMRDAEFIAKEAAATAADDVTVIAAANEAPSDTAVDVS